MKLKRVCRILLMFVFAVCLSGLAVACAEEPGESVKPGITGPTQLELTEQYEATSTGVYTIVGTGVTVEKASGDAKITWNDETKKLDIAAGLEEGTYTVVLTASNGNAEEDATLTFTLTVTSLIVAPSIDGEESLALEAGYAPISTQAYTVAGTNVTVTKTSGDAKITWNDATKKLDIAAGLEEGKYPVVLTVSNGNAAEDATFTFTFIVWTKASVSGPATYVLPSNYIETSIEFVTDGTDVVVTKETGDEKITWNGTEQTLDVATGLAPGKYAVSLKAENEYGPAATADITLFVTYHDEALEEGILATFDSEEYVHNVDYTRTWLPDRPYQSAEIVEDAAAPNGKALKISYIEGEALDEACVEVFLAEPILRTRVKSIGIVLKTENFVTRDSAYNMLIYKNSETPWGVPELIVIAGEEYATYTVRDTGILDAMTDSDGYIRSFFIETFGGTEARALYLGEILCEKAPYTDETLTGNCLGTFDNEEYIHNVDIASTTHPGYSPEPSEVKIDNGSLKISYTGEGENKEIWTRIYFGKAVKRTEISALKFTIRLENNGSLNGGGIALIFFGNTTEWAIDGKYAHPAAAEGVYTIGDAGVLDAMTDADGYIRSVALVSFGGSQSLYIDNIEFVPVG